MAKSQSQKAAEARAEASGRRAAPAADRTVTTTDNLTPEQKKKAAEEVEEAQLISIMDAIKRSRTKEAEEKAKVDAAKLVHKEAQNAVTKVFSNAKVLGYQRNHLEEHYTAVTEKGIRKNQQADEERRARWRRYFCLPVADSRQQELDAKLPEAEKNAQEWESAGYLAGLDSAERKAPTAAVKAGFDQPYLRGYDAATARKAWGLTAAKAIPMPGAKPQDDAKPDEPATQAPADETF